MGKNSTDTWRIDRLGMGRFALDGGAMFGIVPKPLWEKAIPADSRNRIPMQTSCMLLRGFGRNVIVEAGNGWGFDEKERGFYNMDVSPTWEALLQPFGLKPSDITDAVVTHLHFDHACGLSRKQADGSHTLSFANAVHYVQRRQLEWSQKPSERDAGSYRSEGVYPFTSGQAKTKLIDGAQEILPQLRVSVINGHTPAQQLVHVDNSDGHWVFVADLFPTHAHLHLPWIMAYDLFPLDSLKEKKVFLAEATAKQWRLWFYHDPALVAATVQGEGKRYQKGETLIQL